MKYFNPKPKNNVQLKQMYYKLALKYHPDTAGDTPENTKHMQLINEEYGILKQDINQEHKRMRQEHNEKKNTQWTGSTREWWYYNNDRYYGPSSEQEVAIESISTMIRVNCYDVAVAAIVEYRTGIVCITAYGNTYPYRELFKEMEMIWDAKSRRWFVYIDRQGQAIYGMEL